jgi:Domain of unknown function (DUF3883)
MAIPAGITRQDVLTAIRDFQRGINPGFGPSTRYDLMVGRRHFPPKAIVGLAARRVLGHPIASADFSGGEGASSANRVLRRLGFSVVPKSSAGSAATRASAQAGQDWTAEEIALAVERYLQLLRDELAGQHVVKRRVVDGVVRALPARTRGSVEYKFANVSAVLEEEGLPWVLGYKPQHHYQAALREAVLGAVGVGSPIQTAQEAVKQPPSVEKTSDVRVPPPKVARRGGRHGVTTGIRGAMVDATNRALGRTGEEWVLNLERRELTSAGRSDLAGKVEWTADLRGDGFGYDIASFDRAGAPIVIEVKTTNLGPTTPFYVSRGEVAASKRHGRAFRLYRVFDFSRDPRLYELSGDLEVVADLEAVTYLGRPNGKS